MFTYAKSLLLALPLIAASACVASPYNNQVVRQDRAFDISGYASAPNAFIDIQLRNRATGAWRTVKTIRSSANPTAIGETQLYSFATPFTFSRATVDWFLWCTPLGSGTSVECDADEVATMRVQERGGLLAALLTFEQAGLECAANLIADGASFAEAGVRCKSASSPNISIRILE